jgi:thiamine biosynthesis lipoprotein
VDGKSVVTSGNYERYFEVDGKLYHHILDTATGYPVENNLYAVTILSDSSVDGDALSTTCYALGIEDASALIESIDGVEALFITNDYEIIRTSGITDDIYLSVDE